MEQRAYGDGVVFGELKVDAAWVSEWGTPHTVPASVAAHGFARTGRLCIVDPCFDILMSTLNTDTSLSISGVDLSAVGASGPEQALGVAALDDGTLRATGTVMTDAVAGPGGFGETYHATQFYLRLPIDAAP
jgi:hypothetical protein